MVEGGRNLYGCHFQFPDPFSKVATSRTTRYRLSKKRKVQTGSLDDPIEVIQDNSQAHLVLDTGAFQEQDVDSVTRLSSSSSVDESANYSAYEAALNSSSEWDVVGEDVLSDLLPEEPEPEVVSNDPDSFDDITDDAECETRGTELYPGSLLTQTSSSLLIKQYSVRHNLTQEALADLLRLLHLHCPSPNLLPASLYSFQKQFCSLQYPLTLHYYCSACLQDLPDCDVLKCPNVMYVVHVDVNKTSKFGSEACRI